MRFNEQSEPRFEVSVSDVIRNIRRDNTGQNQKIGENMRFTEHVEVGQHFKVPLKKNTNMNLDKILLL